jgi:hypothetical protein
MFRIGVEQLAYKALSHLTLRERKVRTTIFDVILYNHLLTCGALHIYIGPHVSKKIHSVIQNVMYTVNLFPPQTRMNNFCRGVHVILVALHAKVHAP